ncbi:hypothetical protein [Mammaliicoccus sciuri]|uniref:hypothetical protein n=1 Tax=Mammaliicoccus sciuri TaxID=1296 RepID=UPI002B25BAEE|nr:hypothetical protein [Mammaliicoccus sciuri]WQK43271.1 hypothetical protein P3T89_04435 [Mammaliicoccus sciuri]
MDTDNLIFAISPTNWLQLITILVSILSIWLSHYLGTLKDKKLEDVENEKRIYEAKKQKYNALYIPLYRILSKWQPDFTFSQAFSKNNYIDLNKILDDNLQYLSSKSHSLYLDYLYHLNNFEILKDLNIESAEYSSFSSVQTTFTKLIDALLMDGKELSGELNLSDLSKPFRDILNRPANQKHELYNIKDAE